MLLEYRDPRYPSIAEHRLMGDNPPATKGGFHIIACGTRCLAILKLQLSVLQSFLLDDQAAYHARFFVAGDVAHDGIGARGLRRVFQGLGFARLRRELGQLS